MDIGNNAVRIKIFPKIDKWVGSRSVELDRRILQICINILCITDYQLFWLYLKFEGVNQNLFDFIY